MKQPNRTKMTINLIQHFIRLTPQSKQYYELKCSKNVQQLQLKVQKASAFVKARHFHPSLIFALKKSLPCYTKQLIKTVFQSKPQLIKIFSVFVRTSKSNGRYNLKDILGQILNFKLGCFLAMRVLHIEWGSPRKRKKHTQCLQAKPFYSCRQSFQTP